MNPLTRYGRGLCYAFPQVIQISEFSKCLCLCPNPNAYVRHKMEDVLVAWTRTGLTTICLHILPNSELSNHHHFRGYVLRGADSAMKS
jgi:hypothetical protein